MASGSKDGSDGALDARDAPRGASSTQRMTLYATGLFRSKSVQKRARKVVLQPERAAKPKRRGRPVLAARAQKKPGAKNKLQLAAKLAAAAQRAVRLLTVPEEAELDEDEPPAPPEPPETGQQQRKRQRQRHTSWSGQSLKRSTIHYFYMMLNEPSELEWDGAGGTVLQIRDTMLLPRGEKHTKTIRRTLRAICSGEDYDASAHGPRESKEHLMSEAEKRIAADCLIDGMGQWQAMHHVNVWRARRKLLPVSRSTVRDDAFSLGLVKFRRCTTAMGSTDVDSAWAVARLAQAQQLQTQLADESLAAFRPRRGVAGSAAQPAGHIKLEQIAFWDEKHSVCKLGYSSKWGYVMPNADGKCTPSSRPVAPRCPSWTTGMAGARRPRCACTQSDPDAEEAVAQLHEKWAKY